MEIELKVEGMMCEGCEKRIENALTTLEHVEKIKADHKKGIVAINLKGELDKTTIKEKLENLGFQVKEG